MTGFAQIGVVGGGAWGTALACLARRAGRRVTLWSRDPAIARSIAEAEINPVYLPDIALDAGIEAAHDIEALAGCDIVLLVCPAQAVRAVAARLVGTAPIVIMFDEPVASDGPMPQVQPAVAGTWSQPDPTTLRFDPVAPLVPDTSLTVTIARGADGVRADNGGLLSAATTITYKVADGSPLRLQQMLAELHYLPVDFTPTTPEVRTAAAQGAMAFSPPPGQFAMRFASTPAPLAALWQPGAAPALTSGAVMTFEKVHSLVVDGIAGPAVWTALLHDAVDQTMDPQPYSWAWTTLTHPETLKIWVDGQVVFSSKANTGIPAAPTPTGSWPVYARYRTQTMTGTNPDGTTYNDPGVPYISYFRGGDAIHGFQRASYGTEQSLGCVELPYAAAAQVWTLIDYGTVVTVTP